MNVFVDTGIFEVTPSRSHFSTPSPGRHFCVYSCILPNPS